MDDALNIAINYLARTGQAVKFPEAQETAAQAIEVAWRSASGTGLRLTTWPFVSEERLATLRGWALAEASSIVSCYVEVVLRRASARAAPMFATVRDFDSVSLAARAKLLWNGTVPLWLCDHEAVLL